MMKDVLEGIRVLDFSIWQHGPFASVLLGALGAEVIKIEQPISGDPGRGMRSIVGSPVQMPGDRNYYYEACNLNKKSISLDLKKSKGRDVLYELVKKSDVFIQNFRRGVANRLGADYKTLSQYNPRLIYATASGFGPRGPQKGSPSFDYIGTAASGLMTTVGEPDWPPSYPAGGLADQGGAIILAFAILTALLARERLGVGQEIETSQLGSMIAWQGLNVMSALLMDRELPTHRRKKARNPLWNHYLCADDRWLSLACLQSDRYWPDFCNVLGIQELEKDPRFEDMSRREENCEELIKILDKIFFTKKREEWMKALRDGGEFIFSPINTIPDLAGDPQVLASEYIVDFDHPVYGPIKVLGFPVWLSKTPAKVRSAAPELGQHTEEVLIEICGYSWDEIGELKDQQII